MVERVRQIAEKHVALTEKPGGLEARETYLRVEGRGKGRGG